MNTIAERIYDFLKNFPPFSMLSKEQLLSICKSINVHHLEKEANLFIAGNSIKNEFYVVKDGAIGLFEEQTNSLLDKCDEGDIFGLRALMRKNNYKLSAKAIEESIVYSISSELFENFITTNSEASNYLLSSFVSNIRYFETDNQIQIKKNEEIVDFFEEQSADYSKNPIQCNAKTSIKVAALIMTNKRVGSIIITENKKPIGIITDKDLRTKIATGLISIEKPVSKIMSFPVITFPENITVAEAQIAMMKHKITHLCITKDGTTNTELTGLLSEHDIIVIRNNNASILIKEIKRTTSFIQLQQIRQRAEKILKRYLNQQIPITYITKILSSINDSITNQIIELSLKEMPTSAPTSFTWLAIGSQGREEQLLLTDQDNALVFDDVSENDYQRTKQFFLTLSEKINKGLEIVGFKLCPADMMASNPKWCLSASQWKKQFKSWVSKPDKDNLMLCTIFFDFELVYGDKKLVKKLSKSIFKAINSHEIFLNFLGINALKNPPPLSFFRQFLVERDGEHKDQFDIKARAMMPLVDAARLLILSKKIDTSKNTITRFEKLAELEPQNIDVYMACISAFKNLLRYRTQQGLLHKNSGRFIDLSSLNKANRLELKSCFKAVQEVQELIQTRFKLSHFM
jgi:CBS domain-containing protein